MSYKPLFDRVLLSIVEVNNVTSSGIVLTQSNDIQNGKVERIGSLVSNVKVGDVVVPDWSKGVTLTLDGTKYVLMQETFILAIKE